MSQTSTTSTGSHAQTAESVDYRWTTIVTNADGQQQPPRTGAGTFDTADSYTVRIHDSHPDLAAGVFAEVCGELVEYHRDEVLDARVDGLPDPVVPVTATTTVYDADDNVVAVLTGLLRHEPVTEDEVLDAAVTFGQIAVADERIRIERTRRPGGISHRDPLPLALDLDTAYGPELDAYPVESPGTGIGETDRAQLRALRAAAAELRAEVYDPEYCRHQLAAMETARAEARDTDPPIDWHARVDRWRRLLEISTEAYLDAAGIDTAAEQLRTRHSARDLE
ncbi:hypothetical protein [Nocardia wallacei]|uniref:hypothetical protein n=1 Tax=Nocardia wallacei TaxID=480035 RepID=UPI0024577686|nr:hypothetical protein [Nocardia wallacei]